MICLTRVRGLCLKSLVTIHTPSQQLLLSWCFFTLRSASALCGRGKNGASRQKDIVGFNLPLLRLHSIIPAFASGAVCWSPLDDVHFSTVPKVAAVLAESVMLSVLADKTAVSVLHCKAMIQVLSEQLFCVTAAGCADPHGMLMGFDTPRMEGLWPTEEECPGFKYTLTCSAPGSLYIIWQYVYHNTAFTIILSSLFAATSPTYIGVGMVTHHLCLPCASLLVKARAWSLRLYSSTWSASVRVFIDVLSVTR